MGDPIFFYIFAAVTLICAIAVVFLSNPLSSAIALIFCFAGVAGLFVLLNAHFLAAIQVLVYAGAIMVLFIFVIMMFNLKDARKHFKASFASFLGLIVALNIAILFIMRLSQPTIISGEIDPSFGTVKGVGKLMLTQYLVPFEMISLLLTIAAVGAIVIAKQEKQEKENS